MKKHNLLSTISNSELVKLLFLVPLLLLGGAIYASTMLFVMGDFFAFVKYGYWFYTILFPILLLVVSAVGYGVQFQRPVPLFLRRWYHAAFILAFLCFGIRMYATHIEPYRLQIVEHTIASPKITLPVRLVHITDIQSDGISRYEERVFEAVREIEPDILLNTGDNLQPVRPASLESELPKLKALFDRVNPPLGKYCIYGNVGDDRLYEMAGGLMGQTLLENRAETILIGGSRINIHGLGWHESGHGSPAIDAWVKEAEPGDFTILLGHSPDYVMHCKDLPIDLCLAGHVHGGQIVIPGFGPLVTFSRLPRDVVSGFHPVGETYLNVSKGVGTEHHLDLPPIRFFCPPDITVFHLVPESHIELVEK
ncbi:hypothetical protein GF373_16625 [bacterium]|nr:hypothetical protein [bacterium]